MTIRTVLLATLAGLAAPAAPPPAAAPVVIELFQSQGCSSCPPANANLNAVADRADLVPLSFAVTYWDQLGWKDTFAAPAYTARQWEYARAAGRAQVATPQMIVGGAAAINGGNRAQLDTAINAARRPAALAISAAGGRLALGAGVTRAPATVWLVRYDPRLLAVPIRAGENGGKTLPHRNIVRQLTALGSWTGAPARLALPASPDPAWRTAVLVQAGKGGPMLAAARF